MKLMLLMHAWSTGPEGFFDRAALLIEPRSTGWADVTLVSLTGTGAPETVFMPVAEIFTLVAGWASSGSYGGPHHHVLVERERLLPSDPEPDLVVAAIEHHRQWAQYRLWEQRQSASVQRRLKAEALTYLSARGWAAAFPVAGRGASA